MKERSTLDCRNAEACNNILEKGTHAEGLLHRFGPVTLAGAIELFSIAARSANGAGLRKEIRNAARDNIGPWKNILESWEHPQVDAKSQLAARPYEFRRVLPPEASDAEGLDCSAFEQRFVRSVTGSGFPPEFANGIAKVFHEMIDNVLQHSGAGGPAAPAIAAYHAEIRYFAFSVSDLGSGFLASLTRSPDWKSLKEESEALLAVIHHGASSRTGQGEGEGFKKLFKALADRGALVRLRSGGSVARVKPTSEGRTAEIGSVKEIAGTHVSICCRLGAATEEIPCDFC